ncbi:cysteine protease ATG4-like [Wolffia australiana]
MTELPERNAASTFPRGPDSKRNSNSPKPSKTSSWSTIFSSSRSSSLSPETRERKIKSHGWASSVKRAITSVSMRRFHERFLGLDKADITSSGSEVWLLGVCYRISSGESSSNTQAQDNGPRELLNDFSSRVCITYRKGFGAGDDRGFTSDVNWGCMIRSSQMLVAQALMFHHLGRSWRRPQKPPYDPKYIEVLHLFGDSIASTFSIHNLIQAGRGYGLAAGAWVGPYAMCRAWETLARGIDQPMPMAVYVVSGDEDGERGGAPLLYVDIATRLCSKLSPDQWSPLLVLVPLVLGLDKVNPRYIPLLSETFTFSQSLGIIGGKPGASTYIIGVQDDKALFLDPHLVQPVVEIKIDEVEADTSSYHCSTMRQLPLDQLDPSLAIGFYCRDRGDFEDFCSRAINLTEKSNGAPLFTVAESPVLPSKSIVAGEEPLPEPSTLTEDDWQLL